MLLFLPVWNTFTRTTVTVDMFYLCPLTILVQRAIRSSTATPHLAPSRLLSTIRLTNVSEYWQHLGIHKLLEHFVDICPRQNKEKRKISGQLTTSTVYKPISLTAGIYPPSILEKAAVPIKDLLWHARDQVHISRGYLPARRMTSQSTITYCMHSSNI